MKNILILNGPNLNLVGVREPEIYGSVTMLEVFDDLKAQFASANIEYLQSNHEGFLLDTLHEWGFKANTGIILNAGAYTHTSIALADAIAGINNPVIEVHISNIYEREKFRHHSYLTKVCAHHIIGEGIAGYRQAVEWLLDNCN